MVLFEEPNHFLTELYPTFSSLCHDPEISVRRTVADGFHEVRHTEHSGSRAPSTFLWTELDWTAGVVDG